VGFLKTDKLKRFRKTTKNNPFVSSYKGKDEQRTGIAYNAFRDALKTIWE